MEARFAPYALLEPYIDAETFHSLGG